MGNSQTDKVRLDAGDTISLLGDMVRAARGPEPVAGGAQARHPVPDLRPLRQPRPQHARAQRQGRLTRHRRYVGLDSRIQGVPSGRRLG